MLGFLEFNPDKMMEKIVQRRDFYLQNDGGSGYKYKTIFKEKKKLNESGCQDRSFARFKKRDATICFVTKLDRPSVEFLIEVI